MKPLFKHDCDLCKYLESVKLKKEYKGFPIDQSFDLYFCPSKHDPTVIARWSDDGPEYISGIPFALSKSNELLVRAFNLAQKSNYIDINTFKLKINFVFLENELEFLKYNMLKENKSSNKDNNILDVEPFILKLYQYIVNRYQSSLFDNIESMNGFPKINLNTTEKYIDLLCKITNNPQDVMMIWVNNGFSVDEDLEDDIVILSKFLLKEDNNDLFEIIKNN